VGAMDLHAIFKGTPEDLMELLDQHGVWAPERYFFTPPFPEPFHNSPIRVIVGASIGGEAIPLGTIEVIRQEHSRTLLAAQRAHIREELRETLAKVGLDEETIDHMEQNPSVFAHGFYENKEFDRVWSMLCAELERRGRLVAQLTTPHIEGHPAPATERSPTANQVIAIFYRRHSHNRKVTLKQVCEDLNVNYDSIRVAKVAYDKRRRRKGSD
jgi:hypothetical protein